MADQGFSTIRQWDDSVSRVQSRAVPIGPVLLTGSAQAVATAPAQQIMRVDHLAVCNPTGAAVDLSVTVTIDGADFAQISGMAIASHASIDLTALVGQLYKAGSVLSATGAGLVLSGRYGAVL